MPKFLLNLPDELETELERMLEPGENKTQTILAAIRRAIAERRQVAVTAELAARLDLLEAKLKELEEEK